MGGVPETLYVRDGDVYLAYQVLGDRGPDVLFVPGPTFPIDLIWDEPAVAGCLRRLASFTRLILTDFLGCGSSDAVPIKDNPAIQSWTDGLVAVLDAVGGDRASIFAITGAGLPAMMLAASHPQRVHSLILWSTFARFITAPDQSFGFPEPALPSFLERFVEVVGTGATMDRQAPSWSGDAANRRWWARNERLSGGPGHWKSGIELFARTDVRPVLGSIQAPTVVMHRRGDRDAREHSAALAGADPAHTAGGVRRRRQRVVRRRLQQRARRG